MGEVFVHHEVLVLGTFEVHELKSRVSILKSFETGEKKNQFFNNIFYHFLT